MRRLLVMLLVATSMAAVAPAIVSTSAFAADTPCDVNESWRGPYWWGALSAYNQTHTTKVLAITPAWRSGAWAYLWDYNNDPRQKWYMDCDGYDAARGRNIWFMRYADSTNLCLEGFPELGDDAVLEPCSSIYMPSQYWEMVPVGSYRAFYNLGRDRCLDVEGNGATNGTLVVMWTCHYGANQQWY